MKLHLALIFIYNDLLDFKVTIIIIFIIDWITKVCFVPSLDGMNAKRIGSVSTIALATSCIWEVLKFGIANEIFNTGFTNQCLISNLWPFFSSITISFMELIELNLNCLLIMSFNWLKNYRKLEDYKGRFLSFNSKL